MKIISNIKTKKIHIKIFIKKKKMNSFNDVKNNFFFDNNYECNLPKEKIILESNAHRNSISTNETFENEINSENENIDFNQDFFPKNKKIKFTDMLVDNWEDKIKMLYKNIMYKHNLSNKNSI